MWAVISVLKSLKSVSSSPPESQLVLNYKIPNSLHKSGWSKYERLVFGESLSNNENVLNWTFGCSEDLVSGKCCRQLRLSLGFSPTPINVLFAVDKCLSSFDAPDAIRRGRNLDGLDETSTSILSGCVLDVSVEDSIVEPRLIHGIDDESQEEDNLEASITPRGENDAVDYGGRESSHTSTREQDSNENQETPPDALIHVRAIDEQFF